MERERDGGSAASAALSRLLNGKAGVSANMALALEDIGWVTAEHWMRMQASYELEQARRERNCARANCKCNPASRRRCRRSIQPA